MIQFTNRNYHYEITVPKIIFQETNRPWKFWNFWNFFLSQCLYFLNVWFEKHFLKERIISTPFHVKSRYFSSSNNPVVRRHRLVFAVLQPVVGPRVPGVGGGGVDVDVGELAEYPDLVGARAKVEDARVDEAGRARLRKVCVHMY